jgi:cell wall assembly regulator SMI1
MTKEDLLVGINSFGKKSVNEALALYINALKSKVPEFEIELLPPDPNAKEKIDEIESISGKRMPEEFRDLYLSCNGQKSDKGGLIAGVVFLSLDKVITQLRLWADIIDAQPDPETLYEYETEFESYPTKAIRLIYARKGWIPFSHDYGGNSFGVDLDPDVDGTVGQIINFGRDEEIKCVVASNLTEFFLLLTFLTQSGKITTHNDGNNQVTVWITNLHPHDAFKELLIPNYGAPAGPVQK